MPVRSLHRPSNGLTSRRSAQQLPSGARALVSTDERVSSMGYAGSHVRGNWVIGSDVDLIILVRETEAALTERARSFDTTSLPVPADVLVCTEREWARMDR
jgi:uncharacterized protein